MARYRKIEDSYYKDEKVMKLSFCGHAAFLTFLTHDTLTSFGTMRGSVQSFAYSFYHKGEPFVELLLEGLKELLEEGFIVQSSDAPLIYAPNFIKYNLPENPNAIKTWKSCSDEMPQCEDLRNYTAYVREILTNSAACKPWVLEVFGSTFNSSVNSTANGSSNSTAIQRTENREQRYKKDNNKLLSKKEISDQKYSLYDEANAQDYRCKKVIEQTETKYDKGFMKFFNVYPRKDSQFKAWRAYNQVKAENKISDDYLHDAAKRYAQLCKNEKREQKFIKTAYNWLINREYEADLDIEFEDDRSKRIAEMAAANVEKRRKENE